MLSWAIERSNEAGESNPSLETVHWRASCEVRLPGAKKRRVGVDFEETDLPGIPVLVNDKVIKEHTRLIARAEILPVFEAKPKGSSSGAASSGASRP